MSKDKKFLLLLDDGTYVERRYRTYPEKDEYGRPGASVPVTYLLGGKTWRNQKGKRPVKIRWEGKVDDPEKPDTEESVGKILTQFDQDHSKSETLKAQKEETGVNWLYLFVLGFGALMGFVIRGFLH